MVKESVSDERLSPEANRNFLLSLVDAAKEQATASGEIETADSGSVPDLHAVTGYVVAEEVARVSRADQASGEPTILEVIADCYQEADNIVGLREPPVAEEWPLAS